jgi:ABC-type transporter Mla MlaB component
MLRIHTEPTLDGVTLRLEGKLIHPWVDELARIWMDFAPGFPATRTIRIDLEAVSFVDARGRSILVALRRLGCELRGTGPYISAVIEEVSADSSL